MCKYRKMQSIDAMNDREEEIRQTLQVMRKQEATRYQAVRNVHPVVEGKVETKWRNKILSWMFSVVDFCNFSRSVVASAAYYMDVAVSRGVVHSPTDYQLVAMTSLHLALKLYTPSCVDLESMLILARGLFTERDVIQMESRILNLLSWRANPPTQACFLEQLIQLFPSATSKETKELIRSISNVLFEIAMCQDSCCGAQASSTAYAAILLSMECIDTVRLPVWQRHAFVLKVSRVAMLLSKSSQIMGLVDALTVHMKDHPQLKELLVKSDSSSEHITSQAGPEKEQSKSVCNRHSPRSVSIL